MSPAPALKYISVEEYLEMEDVSEAKHEYYSGEMFAMAGGSMAHNRIVRNCLVEIGQFLKDKSCEVFPSDLKVNVKTKSCFVYPDLTIICNAPQFYEGRNDIVTNPVVIIEVLSPHTEKYDRGKKFMLYRQLDFLKEYILISSQDIRIEKFSKKGPNEWILQEYMLPEDSIVIDSIRYQTTLAELYRDVVFEEVDFGRSAVQEKE